jgi:hypothetical protein
MKKAVNLKIKQRIESIEGCTFKDAIFKRYFIQLLGTKRICFIFQINNRTFRRLMDECGFAFRSGSEAVKTQWINNDERKINTSNKLKEVRKWSEPALGCNRPDAVARMKINNPMFDLDIRKRANNKTIETFNKNPKLHNIYHKKLTECEQLIFDFITSKGIECVGNELVNGRFIDIYIPSLNIGIECQNKSINISFDRHTQITQNNTKIIYCTNRYIKKGRFDLLYQYIIQSQCIGSIPSIQGQETVIFGRRNGLFFDVDVPQFTVKCVNVDSQNILCFTAASND